MLKTGGHAVLSLLEADDGAAAWMKLFDEFERRSATDRRRQWRLVHKTTPRVLSDGKACRCYVFRANSPTHSADLSAIPSPPASPPDEASCTGVEAQQLFAYASDYYVSMQGALEKGVHSMLARLRDEADGSDAVCRPGVDADEVVARFDASGVIPAVGLLAIDGERNRAYNAEAGAEAGRTLAEVRLLSL